MTSNTKDRLITNPYEFGLTEKSGIYCKRFPSTTWSSKTSLIIFLSFKLCVQIRRNASHVHVHSFPHAQGFHAKFDSPPPPQKKCVIFLCVGTFLKCLKILLVLLMGSV